MKPICFLDVDGVINACPPCNDNERVFEARGYTICFPTDLVKNIRRLGEVFEMVWLTTWEDWANDEFVRYFIEDGKWPVVLWKEPGCDYPRTKLQGAIDWMKETGNTGRPFVQIDDDSPYEQIELNRLYNSDEPDKTFMEAEFPQPHLLIAPYIGSGLTTEETDKAIEWAVELKGEH